MLEVLGSGEVFKSVHAQKGEKYECVKFLLQFFVLNDSRG